MVRKGFVSFAGEFCQFSDEKTCNGNGSLLADLHIEVYVAWSV